MPDLRVQCHHRLASMSADQWKLMMPSYPDSHAYISLLDSVGMQDFSFKSIVISDDAGPLFYLPLFLTRLNIASLLDGAVGKIATLAAHVSPRVASQQLLGVGMVEAEWSQPGIRPNISPAALRTAWQIAADALASISQQYSASLVTWLNFRHDAPHTAPRGMIGTHHTLASYPCGLLSLPAGGMDGYLSTLGRSTRKDLRRRWRAAQAVDIVKTSDPTPYLDSIIRLYQLQLQRVDLAFGRQRAEFFAQITRRVPGSDYVLYFKNRELVAFNLLIRRGQALVDKYFAMEPAIGREYGLYFVSWLYNIETCLGENISVYHAGSGSETTKARLGCRFMTTSTRYMHRNTLINRGLHLLSRSFAYTPQIDLAAHRWSYPIPEYDRQNEQRPDRAPAPELLAS